MTTIVNLSANPFNLTSQQDAQVRAKLSTMSEKEKIGQLFCLLGDYNTEKELKEVIDTYQPGGFMYRPQHSQKIQSLQRAAQRISKVPLLLGANLESGGDGIGTDGTFYGRQIEVAASNKPENAYRLGLVAAREGKAVGCNWAFAPVVDYNANFANPIINVRTYGDNPDTVIKMGLEYMRAAQGEHVAVAIKHFPGDGVDDRDQHLLTSVNSLSTEDWDKTYGKIYQTMIDNGALTVMAGHIYQPAYTRHFNPKIADKDIYPGSLSPELLQGLLRGKLGFNGMISTDATNMAGFSSQGKRSELLPQAINAGCDMLLFTRDLEEDYHFITAAVQNHTISQERLDEAVLRILATKAALKLFEAQAAGTLVPGEGALKVLQCPEHVQWAKDLAQQSVTLVKDKEHLMPLDSNRTKRLLVFVIGDVVSASGKPPVHNIFVDDLKKAGFEVTLFNEDDAELKSLLVAGSVSALTSRFDAAIYFANVKTASNQTTVRLNWLKTMGFNVPWFVHELPTIFISVANPYHLQDVPMVGTFINGYTANDYVPAAIVDKLVGRSPFQGVSPVDAFCGYWDTKL
ncbi:glycoside hydrolase family 3 protein [Lacticaseibacillus suilingensis]|uniref:glycoside hydrolase family 3 protein n=1 Tax=Lacticaseibacillus suilingensis TaxID=2799577 RepID=UPI0022E92997|nr:glycoside hydrolase family 3 N-terminal domain-containing protein [Lacticaseibacillus suilingensis]